MVPNWVHCNKCCIRFNDNNNTKFYLTECLHINCNNCFMQMKRNENRCLICKSQKGAIELSRDVWEQFESNFLTFAGTIDKLKQIQNFYEFNTTNLLNHIYRKYTMAKVEIQRLCKLNRELKKENTQMIRALKGNVSFCSSAKSTPIPGTVSPSFSSFNMSMASTINHKDINDTRRQHTMRPLPGAAFRQTGQNIRTNNNIPSHGSINYLAERNMQSVPVHRMAALNQNISSSSSSAMYKRPGNYPF